MAASSGIVFAEALLRRDGRVSAQPGAWYPEEVLSLNRVEASLRRAGIDVTKTDRPRSGGLSLRPLTKKGACSRLAQSPPASRPNPTGSVSHAPRLRPASAPQAARTACANRRGYRACRGALLTKTMYSIVRRGLHGHYALPVACRAEIPVRRHDHGHQVNCD